HLMKHLVEHDPGHKKFRDKCAVERAVDPDQAIFDGVATHLDRVAAAWATGPLPPGNRGIDLVVEVARVELVIDLAQVVVLAGGEDHLCRLTPRAAAYVSGVLIDEVAEHAR